MQTLNRPTSNRRSTKLAKDGFMVTLTPAIVAWCDEQSEQENTHRSWWIERVVLNSISDKSLNGKLKDYKDGINKCWCRWGEKKKKWKVYMRPDTMDILQQLSDEVSVSKSECLEFILRALADEA
jgi:hypothetical protein